MKHNDDVAAKNACDNIKQPQYSCQREEYSQAMEVESMIAIWPPKPHWACTQKANMNGSWNQD